MVLFGDVLFFDSSFTFARAVSFNWELLGSIRLRPFIRVERAEEQLWQHKNSVKLFPARGCMNIKDRPNCEFQFSVCPIQGIKEFLKMVSVTHNWVSTRMTTKVKFWRFQIKKIRKKHMKKMHMRLNHLQTHMMIRNDVTRCQWT